MKKIIAMLVVVTLVLVGCGVGKEKLTEDQYFHEIEKPDNEIFVAETIMSKNDPIEEQRIEAKRVYALHKKFADRLDQISPPDNIEKQFPGQHKILAKAIRKESEYWSAYFDYLNATDEGSYDKDLLDEAEALKSQARPLLDYTWNLWKKEKGIQ